MRNTLKYFIILFFLPAAVSAHGLVTTQSQTVGDYRIEFEYNTLGNIFAGDYTIYDTYLLKSSDGQPVDFDSSFIRIQKKDGPAIIAGSLAESPDVKGYASMSGVISEAGAYTAEVDFYQAGKQLARASYDFQIDAPEMVPGQKPVGKTNNLIWQIGLFAAGLAIGAGLPLWKKIRK